MESVKRSRFTFEVGFIFIKNMELPIKIINTLNHELSKRFEKLIKELSGKEFTTKDETPWTHTMDNERRQKNRYINKFELSIALQDFNTILSEIKKLK